MATNSNDTISANRYGQTATWDGLGGTDTLSFDRRTENAFTYTQDASGAIHVDSASGASHEYHFTLTNVERVTIGNTVVDLSAMFPTDSDAPFVSSVTPSNSASNIAISTDIEITFNEAVTKGSGSILIKDGNGNIVENYDVATSTNLTVSGSVLTINPTDYLDLSSNYIVELSAGNVVDIAGNNYLGGGSYNFTTASVNIITGSVGNDALVGTAGDDAIDGGAGRDLVSFLGSSVDYNIAKTDSGYLVTGAGEDVLSNVERLHFDDKNVALDLDGNAGQAYRIYKAAFDRIPDTEGLGYWIGQIDEGMDLVEASARFIDSNEFRTLYGVNPTNEDFLTALYGNVLDRAPDGDGYLWWLDQLETNPEKTWEKVLADFSESPENQANVIGLISNGIEYDLWN